MRVLNPGFFWLLFCSKSTFALTKWWAFPEESVHFHKVHKTAQQMLLTRFKTHREQPLLSDRGVSLSHQLFLPRSKRSSHLIQATGGPHRAGKKQTPTASLDSVWVDLQKVCSVVTACRRDSQLIRQIEHKQFCHGIDTNAILRMLINNKAQ